MNNTMLSPKAIQLMGRIAHRLARECHSRISLQGTGEDAVERILSASEDVQDEQLQEMREQLMREVH